MPGHNLPRCIGTESPGPSPLSNSATLLTTLWITLLRCYGTRLEPPMRSNLARSIAPSQYWDATKVKPPTQVLQESFQLAYFVFPDRSIAIDIVLRALGRLRTRGPREMKRLYWRDKHWARPVRRVARTDADMLQWLTMFESERHERAEEQAGGLSRGRLTIRYIKYLVQFTMTLSSFHVNVGQTRLLHNYSTSEAQCIYEMLTCRVLSPDIYRRAKAGLMDKLAERFGDFIKTTRAEHGELRFETADDQARWSDLVNHCLKLFTPWSTQGLCSHFSAIIGGDGKSTSLYWNADADLNEMEMRSCHVLIEPACYNRLLNALRLEPPATKLALPRFLCLKSTTTMTSTVYHEPRLRNSLQRN